MTAFPVETNTFTTGTEAAGLITDYTYDLVGQLATRTTGAVVDGHAVTYGTWTTTYNAGFLPAKTATSLRVPGP